MGFVHFFATVRHSDTLCEITERKKIGWGFVCSDARLAMCQDDEVGILFSGFETHFLPPGQTYSRSIISLAKACSADSLEIRDCALNSSPIEWNSLGRHYYDSNTTLFELT